MSSHLCSRPGPPCKASQIRHPASRHPSTPPRAASQSGGWDPPHPPRTQRGPRVVSPPARGFKGGCSLLLAPGGAWRLPPVGGAAVPQTRRRGFAHLPVAQPPPAGSSEIIDWLPLDFPQFLPNLRRLSAKPCARVGGLVRCRRFPAIPSGIERVGGERLSAWPRLGSAVGAVWRGEAAEKRRT